MQKLLHCGLRARVDALKSALPAVLLLVTAITAMPAASANVYQAGSHVQAREAVSGDLYAAGGEISVDAPVQADAVLAGGQVDVLGDIGDDLRAAGGRVTVAGKIGGDLVAAGGTVDVRPSAVATGPAMLAGGEVRFDGRAQRKLQVRASKIVLGGRVEGDADLQAAEIVFLPGASIGGNLRYASADALPAQAQALVKGQVTREDSSAVAGRARAPSATRWLSPAFLASMLVSSLVLLALFPHASREAAQDLRQEPGKSALAGLLLLLAWPPLGVLLALTLVGLPLGLALLLLYPPFLLAAWLLGAVGLAGYIGWALRHPFEQSSLPWRIGLLLLALLTLRLVAALPVLGLPLTVLALACGAGSLGLALWQRYRRRGPSGAAPFRHSALTG